MFWWLLALVEERKRRGNLESITWAGLRSQSEALWICVANVQCSRHQSHVLIHAGRFHVSDLALSNSTICLSISPIKGLLTTSRPVRYTSIVWFIHPPSSLSRSDHLVTSVWWLEMSFGKNPIIHEMWSLSQKKCVGNAASPWHWLQKLGTRVCLLDVENSLRFLFIEKIK